MVWLFLVFDEGNRIFENFPLKSSESFEVQMNFEGTDIGYYKIFMPDFSGQEVFVQILDQNHNVISDEIVGTKMSVGYFDFEGGQYFFKISNISDDQLNFEVEFGDSNGRDMIMPGIVTLAGGLMIVVGAYIKLRDYRIEQPDENIS